MYRFKYTQDVFDAIARHIDSYPSINNKLIELESNPYSMAVPTNVPAIGEYYVNAGRFCILFDVDDAQEVISLLKVVSSPYLHKVITGKISIELPGH